MKLVACRHCAELIADKERSCPFCGGATGLSWSAAVAGSALLAGIVLSGCSSLVDPGVPSTSMGSADTDAQSATSGGSYDPPSGEATYGVPVTESWGGGDTTTWMDPDPPNGEATYGVGSTETWYETDTEGYTDTDPDTDTDTDTDADTSPVDTDPSGSESGH